MVLWITLILLGAGAAGLVLGLRGRVVERRLCCRRCGYDLIGIERIPQTKCPECGTNIWTGAVYRHTRERHHGLIRIGYAAFVLAAAVSTIDLLQRFDLLDWYHFRSADSLLAAIEQTNASNPQSRAWAELSRRDQAGRLTEQQVGDAMAIAMDRHLRMIGPADAGRRSASPGPSIGIVVQPAPEHLKWIEAACRRSVISDERIRAYVNRLFPHSVQVNVQPVLHSGYPMIVEFHATCDGPMGCESAELAVMLTDVDIDGQPVEAAVWASIVQTTPFRPTGPMMAASHVSIPIQFSSEAHEVRITYRYGVTHVQIGQGTGAFDIGQPATDLTNWPRTISEVAAQYETKITPRRLRP